MTLKGEGARQTRMLGKALKTDVTNLEQQAVNTESGKAVKPAPAEEPSVSLTVEAPLSYRQHWQIEAKKRRTSVPKLLVEALTKELGLSET